jgi:uncharacterized membrane protein YgdD (TMEM256/DUF423 family)
MNRSIIITAAIFGTVAVIAGAFGAHELKVLISPSELEVWHTAVEYNFYHVFALLFLSRIAKNGSGWVKASFYLFTIGIVFFSGSLYLLACRDLLHIESVKVLGPITPLGGLLFIIGWLSLAIAAAKSK